jgi:predicted nucleic acid-binding protein
MSRKFFDTNIVLYLTDQRDENRLISRGLINAGGVISVQVLNETARVLRGVKFGYSWQDVGDFLASVRAKCEVVPLTLEMHDSARSLAARYQLGIFDANIIAAAVLADCATLFSEDMHNGLVIDGLTIRNPYVKG